MNDVTRILNAVENGDTRAAEQLLPLAYQELRQIAANKMASEREGHTLQPTALVHEAYLRLVGDDGNEPQWKSRGHFFSAAAEAMRRILIEHARRKMAQKRGADAPNTEFDDQKFQVELPPKRLLALDEALTKLEQEHPELAQIVKLRYFAGMTVPEMASCLETSTSTVNRSWKTAKVWLYREIGSVI